MSLRLNTKDDVVGLVNIYSTKNYQQFKNRDGSIKTVEGNRDLDRAHARRLARKFKDEGNLMSDFPAEVTPDGDILDGQHRLIACEINDMPFSYKIVENANSNTIKAINTGNKNWTWKDHINFWSKKGNPDFQKLTRIMKQFEDYKIVSTAYSICLYTSFKDIKPMYQFQTGEFKLPDYDLSVLLIGQAIELCEVADVDNRDFHTALYRFMRQPGYDHLMMLHKVRSQGEQLKSCYTIGDYLITLEDIRKA